MKQYTYPAVFYYDEEENDYAAEFSDICIYVEGDTMEDVYKNAQDSLKYYMNSCNKLGVIPNPPSDYDGILKMHPNGKILFVTVDVLESKKTDKAESQETYTNLNKSILIDGEEVAKSDSKDDLEARRERRLARASQDDGDDSGDDFALPEID